MQSEATPRYPWVTHKVRSYRLCWQDSFPCLGLHVFCDYTAKLSSIIRTLAWFPSSPDPVGRWLSVLSLLFSVFFSARVIGSNLDGEQRKFIAWGLAQTWRKMPCYKHYFDLKNQLGLQLQNGSVMSQFCSEILIIPVCRHNWIRKLQLYKYQYFSARQNHMSYLCAFAGFCHRVSQDLLPPDLLRQCHRFWWRMLPTLWNS